VPLRRVDHCFVVEPSVLDAAPGTLSASVRIAVFAAGLTSMTGRGDNISVDVGVGPGATQPLSTSGWTWTSTTYERDVDGPGPTGARNYDQYRGSFVAPSVAGEYAIAARAKIGDGPYTACSLGVAVGAPYAPAFAVRLTVAAPSAPRVGYCNLQFPRVVALAAGTTSAMPIFGRVFANTVTNRGCTDMPSAAQLGAQWGHGPSGSFPSSATWTWVDGRYSAHRDSVNPLIEGNCANIEYQVTPRAPTECAPRAYAWRFRIAEGPWTYCRWAPPAEGAPTTPPFDVYDPMLAGAMAVTGCP
jgi:hypothetical protein